MLVEGTVNATTSVTYTRWGRTSCPSHASLVYKGRVGGGHYNNPVSGTNPQCLPENPIYDKYYTGSQNVAYMYNAEYEVFNFNPFPGVQPEDDVPCAVCNVGLKSTMIMIPARNECPSTWQKEYSGYLMSEYFAHKHSSEYLCVDHDAEAVPGTVANNNGMLLYFVDGVCGGHLQCSPYVANRELTCAVCTK